MLAVGVKLVGNGISLLLASTGWPEVLVRTTVSITRYYPTNGAITYKVHGCLALYYQGRPVVIMEVKKAVRSIPEGTHARHGLNTVPCA